MAVQLADDQREEALRTCLLNFRLARPRVPVIMGQLTAIAICGVAVRDADGGFCGRASSPPSAYQAIEDGVGD